jgi:hypothetical protein
MTYAKRPRAVTGTYSQLRGGSRVPCLRDLVSYRGGVDVVVNASCDGTSDWAYYQCPPPAKCAFWNDTAQRWSTEVRPVYHRQECTLLQEAHRSRNHVSACPSCQGMETLELSESGPTVCAARHLTQFSSLFDPIDFVGVSSAADPPG